MRKRTVFCVALVTLTGLLLLGAVGVAQATTVDNLRPKLVVTVDGQDTILSPGPGLNDGSDDGGRNAGKDANMKMSNSWYTGYSGDNPRMWIINSYCNSAYVNGFLQFSLTDLPTSIDKAEIWVYTWVFFIDGYPWYASPTFSLHQITNSWNEMSSTAPSYAAATIDPHTVPVKGGSDMGRTYAYTEFEGWLKFDITNLYNAWQAGTTPNYGVALVQDNSLCHNGMNTWVITSDWPKPTFVSGPTTGQTGTSYSYTSGGAHFNPYPTPYFNPAYDPAVYPDGTEIENVYQYQFDWGDGTQSEWSLSTSSVLHAWEAPGTYTVKARARLQGAYDEGDWGPWLLPGLTVNISGATINRTITASAGTGGTITPSGAVSVNYGANQSFSIAPDLGYGIADVLVDGVSLGAVGSYTFTNVTADHTITATFSAITYTITASAGSGGTITPSGAVPVNYGANQSFNITPDLGYSIADVIVDGVSIGQGGSYTFNNITANHSIVAAFSPMTYTLSYFAGANGSINGMSPQIVDYGLSGSAVSAVPDTGYHFVDWSDGSTDNPRTDVDVTEDKSVTANFAINSSNTKIQLVQGILSDLIALRANVTDKNAGVKLDQAISHLTDSFDPEYWTDEDHLNPKKGDKVFNDIKDTINKLGDLLKDKKSTLSDDQVALIQGSIDNLVTISRAFAQEAIDEAINAGGEQKEIDLANEELVKGDSENAEGKYNSTIEHYRNAWQHALKSVRNL